MREHIILGLPGDAMAAVNKHYAIGFPATGVYIVHMQCISIDYLDGCTSESFQNWEAFAKSCLLSYVSSHTNWSTMWSHTNRDTFTDPKVS